MSVLKSWWTRLGTVVGALLLAVFVPAAAWAAQSGAYEVADEFARRRPRGAFGVIGALCCLVVVGAIVVAVVLVMRRRSNPR